ncbi:uncharacterized protein LOC118760808 [Ochotona princeps]|uniref:uncharacterized protein LOC118760808 n=1 Tax=Ochotona princeps TaxID=9978 RepID=UPI002714F907|nr:uncharacterized protein LOC118760808 [Ochotona princeps]
MSQRPDPQGTQTAAPNRGHAISHPVTHNHRLSLQEPFPSDSPRSTSSQESQSPETADTIQDRGPEPRPALRTRRVSIQEPLPSRSPRRASIQEPPETADTIQDSGPEPRPALRIRRVSIQEPLPSGSPPRASVQEPLPSGSPRRASVQEPLPSGSPWRASVQEPLPSDSSRRASVQEPLPSGSPRRASIREDYLALQSRRFSLQTSPSLASVDSASSHNNLTIQTRKQCLAFQARYSIDIPPSITHSPQSSISNLESVVIWGSQESLGDRSHSLQPDQDSLEDNHSLTAAISVGDPSSRAHKGSEQLLLPVCWRLLHDAKRITRYTSLVLTLAGILTITLVSLGQPWMHFQVPLGPARERESPPRILIKTVLFVQCPDSSCLREYDQNAYLLDLAWTFFVFSSICGVYVFFTLISTIFFSTSNVPVLDFSIFLSSILTATSMVLGVLFYLLQAGQFLQEGMTYRLGVSFYMTWAGAAFFLLAGLLSYLNYMNFWFILVLEGNWT